MTAHADNIAPRRAAITPWAQNHLRLVAGARFAIAGIAVIVAAFLFSSSYRGYVAVPLVVAALNVAIGYWQLSAVRSARPRT